MQVFGDAYAGGGLLVGGIQRNKAAHGFHGVGGVHGGENEVAGLCGFEGDVEGFDIAHFTHEDHVGILAEGAFERDCERGGVFADFSLGNSALFLLMHELDRIFHGEDMEILVLVEVVDHRGERGAFA